MTTPLNLRTLAKAMTISRCQCPWPPTWVTHQLVVRQTQGGQARGGGEGGRETGEEGAGPFPGEIGEPDHRPHLWGKAWCDNLESYRDFAHRLERGRTYVRGGYVIDLQVGAGRVNALVQGSSLYKIDITLSALSPAKWKAFRAPRGRAGEGVVGPSAGKISPDLLADITRQGEGLFPSPKEIQFKCSCPDWASMCKHVAAALYGVGARLDTQPDLFFKPCEGSTRPTSSTQAAGDRRRAAGGGLPGRRRAGGYFWRGNRGRRARGGRETGEAGGESQTEGQGQTQGQVQAPRQTQGRA